MEIIFLGTGSMVPTIERNATSMLIRHGSENILIDCGEGTQKQFRYANISPAKITMILITHWHGDHVFGLPGLLTSIAKFAPGKRITIYGPVGSKRYLGILLSSYIPFNKADIMIHEIDNDGIFFENEDFMLEAFSLKHTARCLGYSLIEKDKRNVNLDYLAKFDLKKHPMLGELQKGKDIVWNNKKIKASDATTIRKGKKVSIVLDSKECSMIKKKVKSADLLICEATLGDEFQEMAEEYMHLTATQSARIAREANVGKLIMTHFSQRYKSIDILLKEARKTFKNAHAAADLMRVLV